jgi:hypothetical protein
MLVAGAGGGVGPRSILFGGLKVGRSLGLQTGPVCGPGPRFAPGARYDGRDDPEGRIRAASGLQTAESVGPWLEEPSSATGELANGPNERLAQTLARTSGSRAANPATRAGLPPTGSI